MIAIKSIPFWVFVVIMVVLVAMSPIALTIYVNHRAFIKDRNFVGQEFAKCINEKIDVYCLRLNQVAVPYLYDFTAQYRCVDNHTPKGMIGLEAALDGYGQYEIPQADMDYCKNLTYAKLEMRR